MSDHDAVQVVLSIEEPDSDPEQVEEDLAYLLDEIGQLDEVEVDRIGGGSAPDGVRAGPGLELATAIIGLGSSGATLPVLLAAVRDWLRRRQSGTIRLKIGADEIEIKHPDPATQHRLVDEFVRRHQI